MAKYIILNFILPLSVGIILGSIIGELVVLVIKAVEKKKEKKLFWKDYTSILKILKDLRGMERDCFDKASKEKVQYVTNRATRFFHLLVQGESTIDEEKCGGDEKIEINVKDNRVY